MKITAIALTVLTLYFTIPHNSKCLAEPHLELSTSDQITVSLTSTEVIEWILKLGLKELLPPGAETNPQLIPQWIIKFILDLKTKGITIDKIQSKPVKDVPTSSWTLPIVLQWIRNLGLESQLPPGADKDIKSIPQWIINLITTLKSRDINVEPKPNNGSQTTVSLTSTEVIEWIQKLGLTGVLPPGAETNPQLIPQWVINLILNMKTKGITPEKLESKPVKDVPISSWTLPDVLQWIRNLGLESQLPPGADKDIKSIPQWIINLITTLKSRDINVEPKPNNGSQTTVSLTSTEVIEWIQKLGLTGVLPPGAETNPQLIPQWVINLILNMKTKGITPEKLESTPVKDVPISNWTLPDVLQWIRNLGLESQLPPGSDKDIKSIPQWIINLITTLKSRDINVEPKPNNGSQTTVSLTSTEVIEWIQKLGLTGVLPPGAETNPQLIPQWVINLILDMKTKGITPEKLESKPVKDVPISSWTLPDVLQWIRNLGLESQLPPGSDKDIKSIPQWIINLITTLKSRDINVEPKQPTNPQQTTSTEKPVTPAPGQTTKPVNPTTSPPLSEILQWVQNLGLNSQLPPDAQNDPKLIPNWIINIVKNLKDNGVPPEKLVTGPTVEVPPNSLPLDKIIEWIRNLGLESKLPPGAETNINLIPKWIIDLITTLTSKDVHPEQTTTKKPSPNQGQTTKQPSPNQEQTTKQPTNPQQTTGTGKPVTPTPGQTTKPVNPTTNPPLNEILQWIQNLGLTSQLPPGAQNDPKLIPNWIINIVKNLKDNGVPPEKLVTGPTVEVPPNSLPLDKIIEWIRNLGLESKLPPGAETNINLIPKWIIDFITTLASKDIHPEQTTTKKPSPNQGQTTKQPTNPQQTTNTGKPVTPAPGQTTKPGGTITLTSPEVIEFIQKLGLKEALPPGAENDPRLIPSWMINLIDNIKSHGNNLDKPGTSVPPSSLTLPVVLEWIRNLGLDSSLPPGADKDINLIPKWIIDLITNLTSHGVPVEQLKPSTSNPPDTIKLPEVLQWIQKLGLNGVLPPGIENDPKLIPSWLINIIMSLKSKGINLDKVPTIVPGTNLSDSSLTLPIIMQWIQNLGLQGALPLGADKDIKLIPQWILNLIISFKNKGINLGVNQQPISPPGTITLTSTEIFQWVEKLGLKGVLPPGAESNPSLIPSWLINLIISLKNKGITFDKLPTIVPGTNLSDSSLTLPIVLQWIQNLGLQGALPPGADKDIKLVPQWIINLIISLKNKGTPGTITLTSKEIFQWVEKLGLKGVLPPGAESNPSLIPSWLINLIISLKNKGITFDKLPTIVPGTNLSDSSLTLPIVLQWIQNLGLQGALPPGADKDIRLIPQWIINLIISLKNKGTPGTITLTSKEIFQWVEKLGIKGVLPPGAESNPSLIPSWLINLIISLKNKGITFDKLPTIVPGTNLSDSSLTLPIVLQWIQNLGLQSALPPGADKDIRLIPQWIINLIISLKNIGTPGTITLTSKEIFQWVEKLGLKGVLPPGAESNPSLIPSWLINLIISLKNKGITFDKLPTIVPGTNLSDNSLTLPIVLQWIQNLGLQGALPPGADKDIRLIPQWIINLIISLKNIGTPGTITLTSGEVLQWIQKLGLTGLLTPGAENDPRLIPGWLINLIVKLKSKGFTLELLQSRPVTNVSASSLTLPVVLQWIQALGLQSIFPAGTAIPQWIINLIINLWSHGFVIDVNGNLQLTGYKHGCGLFDCIFDVINGGINAVGNTVNTGINVAGNIIGGGGNIAGGIVHGGVNTAGNIVQGGLNTAGNILQGGANLIGNIFG